MADCWRTVRAVVLAVALCVLPFRPSVASFRCVLPLRPSFASFLCVLALALVAMVLVSVRSSIRLPICVGYRFDIVLSAEAGAHLLFQVPNGGIGRSSGFKC
jgi:hypothetical protein